MDTMLFLLALVYYFSASVNGFTPNNVQLQHHQHYRPLLTRKNLLKLNNFQTDLNEIHVSSFNFVNANNNFFVASSDSGASQEWRQYFVLAVILGVLLDILLGSPLANAALSPIRGAAEVDEISREEEQNDSQSQNTARVDTDAIVQDALDKATGIRELNDYLEKNKTDKQRIEELARKIDKQLED